MKALKINLSKLKNDILTVNLSLTLAFEIVSMVVDHIVTCNRKYEFLKVLVDVLLSKVPAVFFLDPDPGGLKVPDPLDLDLQH